jgi:hypothetical protein
MKNAPDNSRTPGKKTPAPNSRAERETFLTAGMEIAQVSPNNNALIGFYP